MTIAAQLVRAKYISLASFRKNGTPVYTPLWFAESAGKLYVMTRSDSGKYKRIRNNPNVKVAPCNMRGKITGPEFNATAHVLELEKWPQAKAVLQRKYWLLYLPFWSSKNVYLEIEVVA